MRLLKRFRENQAGNVLMLTGLSILILFAMAGAGIDFGRQQLVRMKLQNASDAAAIAAASLPPDATDAQRQAIALRYFNLNYPEEYMGIDRPDPNIEIGANIAVGAQAQMNTNFISNVGVTTLDAGSRSVVGRAQGSSSKYDILLVMDNSGSMAYEITAPDFSPTPQAEVKNAHNLIALFCTGFMGQYATPVCNGAAQPPTIEVPNPYFYLRPFMHTGYPRAESYDSISQCTSNYANEFCYQMSDDAIQLNAPGPGDDSYAYGFTGSTRLNALRFAALNFVTQVIDNGVVGSRIGLIPWADQVRNMESLTNNAAVLRQRLNLMAAWRSTNPYKAMVAANAEANNFDSGNIKAVVLLTDGRPTLTGDVGEDGCDGNSFCPAAISKTLPICNQLKDKGVQVYTIGFGLDNAPDIQNDSEREQTKNFLRSCASINGKGETLFFDAPTGEELNQAFTKILTALGKIRIAE